jgi:hypothetical protein
MQFGLGLVLFWWPLSVFLIQANPGYSGNYRNGFNYFGLGNIAGFTFGAFGIAIAPRGWKKHYVAHELIHYWQAENFGSIVLLIVEPWLIEGMAYALSNDPRKELHERFESYRRTFYEWRRLNAGIPIKKSVGEVL